ncbi:glycosyltransferase family 4 protein [Luteimonas sp. A482]
MSVELTPAVWLPTIRAGTGADVFTMRLCAGLNARGVRAEITWLPRRAEYLPWTVQVARPPEWANVAHVNSWLPQRFWPKGLPTVVTVHHLVHDPAYKPYRSIPQAVYHGLLIRRRELAAIRNAGAVTVVSDYVKWTVNEFSGREKVTVIGNWIDPSVFTPAPDAGRRSAGPFRLFMAGTQSFRKGYDLLPAFSRALGAGFEIRYAGGKARSTSPFGNPTELGRISARELIREYQECDAVASLSRYEGFGYTALEAMACGKPFLGFAGSGLSEVVEHGRTALMAPIGDVAQLATNCRLLRDAPGLLAEMGMAGRRRAERAFAAGDALDAYLKIYLGLVSQGRVGG